MNETANTRLYGLMAEFEDAGSLLTATKRTRDAGYDHVNAYTPYYVEGLGEILEVKTDFLPWLVFIGILLGASAAFTLQWFTDVVQYPLNIGGRPFFSYQAFMIITFEGGILGGALGAVAGMLLTTNLPLPYHPIFNGPDFDKATSEGFFLLIEERDRGFDEARTREFLQDMGPTKVSEVTW